MHGYIYIYLDMIYMVITLPKAGYDSSAHRMAKWTTPETKAKILALNKVGLTNHEIALSLKPHVDVDPSTVGRIIKKYAETPELVTEKLHISGRPPKLLLKDV
jgi:hypothetical protein